MAVKEYILDTNLYLSFFTNRDQEQYKIAYDYISKLKKSEVSIYLPNLIIAEIVYILDDYYNFSREKIVECLFALISEENLQTENKENVLLAVSYFQKSNLDFADCYILACQENSNLELVTFDKKLKNKKK